MLSNDYKRKVCCMAAGAPAAFCRTSRRGFASPQSARSSSLLYSFSHSVTESDFVLGRRLGYKKARNRTRIWPFG